MTPDRPAPLIGVPACLAGEGPFAWHRAGAKYLEAVVHGASAVPLVIPALGDGLDSGALLDRLDGLMLTGATSNVGPDHYGGARFREGTERDPARDATVLPLVRAALARGLPFLGVCRGIQELNVALGGTLHPYLWEVPGRFDHRSDATRPMAERYALAHPVDLAPGGALARLFDTGRIEVNSLHGQGLDRLASGLAVEAQAEDGTVEAVRVERHPGFALAVQWHPEWRVSDIFHHRRLFAAFGAAAAARAAARGAHDRAGILASGA